MPRPVKTWADKLKELIENRIEELKVKEDFKELEVLAVVVEVGNFIDNKLNHDYVESPVYIVEGSKAIAPMIESGSGQSLVEPTTPRPISNPRITMKPEGKRM